LSKEFREEEIVYVMCRSGMRSLMAITMMSKMDWAKGKKLVSVRGGIMGLEKEGVVMVTE
jgi:rhodanese-related sulfurtransferase